MMELNEPAIDLADFLNARLDEDEVIARAATDGNWVVDRPILTDGTTTDISAEDTTRGYSSVTTDSEGFGSCSLADAAHIARHDPARVLADVQAKRAIIDLYDEISDYDTRIGAAVRILASVYADHPQFDPAWQDPLGRGSDG